MQKRTAFVLTYYRHITYSSKFSQLFVDVLAGSFLHPFLEIQDFDNQISKMLIAIPDNMNHLIKCIFNYNFDISLPTFQQHSPNCISSRSLYYSSIFFLSSLHLLRAIKPFLQFLLCSLVQLKIHSHHL